jgi:ABC-2 type transport system ATP-binding protein
VIELKNLTKVYAKSHLGKVSKTLGIEDLNLEVRSGEIFGLLGLNGAGKTTTLKLILGLLFPTRGEISILGRKLPDPEIIRKVGFLPEVPYFPKHFTVEEMLRFYGRLSGLSGSDLDRRSEETLKLLKMWSRKDKRVRECSKGMLQRLSLAQSLIHDPEILILDEPITGLDPLGLSEMRELILGLNARGKTVLFSSHIIAEVEKIAHRAAILVNGRCAKVLESKEWSQTPGSLEKIFVQTVQELGGDAV